MKRALSFLCLVAVLVGGSLLTSKLTADDKKPEPQIGHMVFFELKDKSPEARAKLVELCNKYLSGHDGTIYYSAGIIGAEFNREVNDRDFDVALHLVFVNKAAHDKYQDAARHLKFIEEGKENWKKVRVFDSLVMPIAK